MFLLIASLVLSFLLFVEASPASSSSDLTNSSISISAAATDAISSVGFSIKISSEENEDDQENSPAIALVAAAHEEQEEQEEQEDEESEKNNKEDYSTIYDKEVDESIFASAGLVYNKAIGKPKIHIKYKYINMLFLLDLPVYRQGRVKAGDNLPPVPQVVACRADGQVAITYVRHFQIY